MKKWLGAFAVALLLTVGAWAEGGRNFGMGLVLGDPTGLTAKYWTSSTTALDFGLGWSGYWNQRDPSCNDGYYYDTHRHYCNYGAYDYHDGYGYGWDILHIHADYLFHNFDLIRATERFPLFYGPGVAINYYDQNYLQIGIRGDFGIAWMPRRAPMDLFLELAPTLYIFPGPHLGVSAGLGARYYF